MRVLFILTLSVFVIYSFGQVPTITSFSPTSGPVGTTVTIVGSNFDPSPANNKVFFGATRAYISTATTTQLTAVVPVGASYQPITILVNGLLSYSNVPFLTTYSGWGIIDATSFLSSMDFVTAVNPVSVSTGDLDGDGKVDMVVANLNGSSVSILRNNSAGAGTVSYIGSSFSTPLPPQSVTLGDLDGDGKLDIVVPVNNLVYVFRNTSTGAGVVSFAAGVGFTVGANPQSVALGDLDGDGRVDIAVDNGSSAVSVLRNTSIGPGSISYAAKIDYGTGTATAKVSIALGDLDGDNKLDIAVTSLVDDKVSIFQNTSTVVGNISYETKGNLPTGSGPYSISMGDLDGDGKIDLAVANNIGNTLSVIRNSSTGPGNLSFATKVDYPAGLQANSVSIGDLDGDSKVDITVANIGGSISLFRNMSSGTGISYAPKVDYTTGAGSNSVAIGDSDGDGKSDIFVTNYYSGIVSVLRHEPLNGQAITLEPIPDKIIGDAPFSPASASSGLPIVYTSSNPLVAAIIGGMVTIVGRGHCTITASQSGNSTYSAAQSVSQVMVVGPLPAIFNFTPASGPVGTTVTINGIGFSPIAANNVVMFGDTRATVSSTSTTQITVAVPVGASYKPITVLTDGLIAYSRIPFLTSYLGWGKIDATSFVPKVNFASGTYPYSVALGDLDGDGRIDMVVANYSSHTVSVFRNTTISVGSVTYAAKVDYSVGLNPVSVALGDLDADGKLDMAVANSGSNGITVFQNTSTGIGDIGFVVGGGYATGTNPYAVALGDLDGDGKVDMAVANNGSGTVSVFRNTSASVGTITYAAKIDYTSGVQPSSIALGDLDADGKVDIATVNSANNTLSVFRNTGAIGTISYANKITYTTSGRPISIALGDLDLDGKLDIAVCNSNYNNVSVFRNTSTGAGTVRYDIKVDYPLGSSTAGVAIGDLDGDGKPDIAVTRGSTNVASTLRNKSTGEGFIDFEAKVDFAVGAGLFSIAIGDLDGDGKGDMAVTNGNFVSVIRHELLSSQSITFNPIPNKVIPDIPFSPASSSSGLPITYTSSNPAVATGGDKVYIVGLGSCTITATQPGNSDYLAAISVSQNLKVCEPVSITPNSFSICIGGDGIQLTASGANTYVWTPSTGLSSTTGATVTANPTSTTSYTVTGSTAGSGCANTAQITVTVNPKPVMTSPTSVSVCSGDLTSLALTSSIGATYSWIATDNPNTTGESITSQTSSTLNDVITNSTLSVQTVTYTVTPTSTSGACLGTSQTVTVTVNPKPTITLGSDPVVCSSTTTSLFPYTAIAGSPNQYRIDWVSLADQNPATLSGGSFSITGLPNLPSGQTTTLRGAVFVRNATTGCESLGDSIRVYKGVAINLGAMPTVCTGVTTSSIPYSNPFGSPSQYNLDWSTGGPTDQLTYVSLPTGSIPIIGIPVNTTVSPITHTGILKIQNLNLTACPTQYNVSLVVNPKPSTSSISGSSPVCANSIITYSVANTPGSTYLWSVTGGIPNSVINANSFTVKWGSSGTGSLSLIETNSYGCTTSLQRSITKNQSPYFYIDGVKLDQVPIYPFDCTISTPYSIGGHVLEVLNSAGSPVTFGVWRSNTTVTTSPQGSNKLSISAIKGNTADLIINFSSTSNSCTINGCVYLSNNAGPGPARKRPEETVVEENSLGMGIYPNPANSEALVVLSSKAETDCPVQFIDVSGRVLISGIVSKGTIEKSFTLEALNTGIYIVHFSDNGVHRYKKLIVSKE